MFGTKRQELHHSIKVMPSKRGPRRLDIADIRLDDRNAPYLSFRVSASIQVHNFVAPPERLNRAGGGDIPRTADKKYFQSLPLYNRFYNRGNSSSPRHLRHSIYENHRLDDLGIRIGVYPEALLERVEAESVRE